MVYRVPGENRSHYDLLVNHARLNKKEMDLTVPHATYVSILRNPVAQLESAFTYFKLFEGLNISGTDKFGVFLSDPHKYFNTSQHDLLRNGQIT